MDIFRGIREMILGPDIRTVLLDQIAEECQRIERLRGSVRALQGLQRQLAFLDQTSECWCGRRHIACPHVVIQIN